MTGRRRPLRAAVVAAAALAAWPAGPATAEPVTAPATAPAGEAGPPPGSAASDRAVITADELTHDRALDTVTARGGVEILYGGRMLLADTVSYQIGKDHATASGNVTLVEADGTTLFADYIELEDEFKSGLVREIRLLLQDGSRAAAREAVRDDGRTVMQYGVYSACDRCADDPDRPRIWQVKALRIVHDEATRDIVYRDASLELWGVPVLYTPYLSHPDPSVKRRSGLLAPIYGGSRDLGGTLTVPYYYAFSPHHDATLSPMVTTNEGFVLGGEHRIALDHGRMVTEGSITHDNNGRLRNHFLNETRFDLDDTWRAGADIALTSDDTYLRTYGFHSPSFLTTRPFVEGFSRRSHAFVEGYYFQDLVESDVVSGDAPVVAPLMGWNYTSEPGQFGGWHSGEVSGAILERDTGADSRRISAAYGWHLPYTGPMGDVYRMDLGLRGDLYHVNDVEGASTTALDGMTGRVVPSAALTWSFPLERTHPSFHEVVEPIVMGVLTPRGQNRERIPNEDSVDFEFDETNLFQVDRFPGHDRVEGGPRINYGLQYAAYGGTLGRFTATVGQTWHAYPDGAFSPASGLDEQMSDYIGRITVRPGENLDIVYRFRLDKDNLKAQRNTVSASIGPPLLRLSGNYLSLAGAPLDDGGVRPAETLEASLTSAFSRYWTVEARTRYDLIEDSDPLEIGGGLTYEDECIAVAFSGSHEYTRDRDYEGGFRVALRVVLKTLGEVKTSAGQ
jgi:LPS-assembly protein